MGDDETMHGITLEQGTYISCAEITRRELSLAKAKATSIVIAVIIGTIGLTVTDEALIAAKEIFQWIVIVISMIGCAWVCVRGYQFYREQILNALRRLRTNVDLQIKQVAESIEHNPGNALGLVFITAAIIVALQYLAFFIRTHGWTPLLAQWTLLFIILRCVLGLLNTYFSMLRLTFIDGVPFWPEPKEAPQPASQELMSAK